MTTPVNQSSLKHQAWGLMCGRKRFTCREIAQTLDVKTSKLVGLIKMLINREAIKIIKKGEKDRGNTYRVVIGEADLNLKKALSKPKRRRSVRGTQSQQVWNAIRIHRVFTMELLQTTTSASLSLINNYVWHLEQCGFIGRQKRFVNQAGYSCVRFRLLKDIGRLYPKVQKQGMWDQNTQQFYPFKERGDE